MRLLPRQCLEATVSLENENPLLESYFLSHWLQEREQVILTYLRSLKKKSGLQKIQDVKVDFLTVAKDLEK